MASSEDEIAGLELSQGEDAHALGVGVADLHIRNHHVKTWRQTRL
jgi:hypothetical protein